MVGTQPPSDAERLAAKQALTAATEALTNRVSVLADAVETNNEAIRGLRTEVNRKPDDSEVKFITGMAKADRRRVRNAALATAVVSALISSLLAFAVADYRSDQRCEESKKLPVAIVAFLNSLPDPSPTLQEFLGQLNREANKEC